MRLCLALAGLAVLVGCGGGSAAAPRDTRAPGRVLSFRAEDGVRLRGELTPAGRPRAPAVVLVHGLHGGPEQWDGFAADLRRQGFATLAYASRRDDETDEAVLARDVAGAVRALRDRPEVDPDRVVLAGTSVGGAAVVHALGVRPGLAALGGVAFSTVAVARAGRAGFRPHDLLLISDQREAGTARRLRADAGGSGITIFTVEAGAHGSALLRDPVARARAVEWLRRLTAERA